MTLPNFLLIGAAKAGTTSLHRYLRQHPQVFLPERKTPRFFGVPPNGWPAVPGRVNSKPLLPGPQMNLAKYESLFAGVTTEKAIGEASGYLWTLEAPSGIRALLPQVKLLAVLRQPADRAFSLFLMTRRLGMEPCRTFAAAWRVSPQRQKLPPPRLVYGLDGYTPALRRYYELFPREQIRVWLYDDLVADPPRLLREMFGFLGVAQDFTPDVSERTPQRHAPNAAQLLPVPFHGNRRTVAEGPRVAAPAGFEPHPPALAGLQRHCAA